MTERRWLGLVPARRPSPMFGVALATVLTVIGTAAHWLLLAPLPNQLPFITYFPIVMLAAVWGGLWGGLTAAALAIVLGTILFLPHSPQMPLKAYMAHLAAIVLAGATIIVVSEILTRTVRALAVSEDRLRLLLDATSAFVIRLDPTGARLFPSQEWRDFTGQKHERRGCAWREMVHPDDLAAVPALADQPLQAEVRLNHTPSKGHRWARLSFTPVSGRNGVREWLAAVEDIHERKVEEERGKVLADELAHRARNGIAMVQSIVSQSAQGAASAQALRDTVIERLQAMSRAQEALELEKGETATMAEIVARVLTPFDRSRFDVTERGSAILERPQAIVLALILYELGTNAMKYGALSAPAGRVTLEHGARRDGLVSVTWRESGGPPVTPSERQGFGHRLLTNGPASLGGASSISMDAAGVRAELSFRA